jgi:hypothetical protein
MKRSNYRCGCCDKIVPDTNGKFIPYYKAVESERSTMIAVCNKCVGQKKRNETGRALIKRIGVA